MHLQKMREGRSFSLFPKLLRLFYVGMILDVCSKDFIPPCEGRCIIPNEVHVVEIVVPRTRVEGDEVQRVDGNVVATEMKATQLLVRHTDSHTLNSSSTPPQPLIPHTLQKTELGRVWCRHHSSSSREAEQKKWPGYRASSSSAWALRPQLEKEQQNPTGRGTC